MTPIKIREYLGNSKYQQGHSRLPGKGQGWDWSLVTSSFCRIQPVHSLVHPLLDMLTAGFKDVSDKTSTASSTNGYKGPGMCIL